MRHILTWWALIEALGLLTLPLTFRLFSPAHAHGYPFTKILTIVLLAYLSWIFTFTGLVPLGVALFVVLGLLTAAAIAAAWLNRAPLAEWLRGGGWAAMLRHDALWTAGFLFFVWQRSLAPEIFGAEKYMDFSFLNTLIRTDVMPPVDPWMSGRIFNYYYLGYLTFADLVRLSGIPGHIAYNLCIATIGGLGFSEFAALGLRLTGRLSYALLAGANTMVLGNLDGFLQVLERRALAPMDYWRSSRVVASGDTINEFPFFSTIHGDLHPHFMVLPVTGLLLGLLLDRGLFPPRGEFRLERFGALIPLALATLALASMVVFSPWELPVAGLLLVLLLGRDLPFWPLVTRARLQLLLQVGGVLVAAYLLYLPFYVHFTAPTGGGVGFRVARTALGEFLTVFGALLFPLVVLVAIEARRLLAAPPEWRHLLIALAGLLIAVAAVAGNAVIPLLLLTGGALAVLIYRHDDDAHRAPLTLATVAFVALLACEFVFLRDSYGDKLYRMNTVFKLYFQAWLLLSLSSAWALAVLLHRQWEWRPAPRLVAFGAACLLLAACAYPLGLTATRLQNPRPPTLDGTEYLAREHPDDFAALEWLRDNVGGLPVILEATGDPYSYYARFSSNTGLPTVLGWANHEGLWRANHKLVGDRRSDVIRMYNAATLESIAPLLDRYQVRYIVVGELERKDYDAAGLQKFTALPLAYRHGDTAVYRR